MKKIITVVGCGFIGSHVADEIAKLCFSQELFPVKFRFIDFDTWEERNAANQNVSGNEARKEEFKAITCMRMAESYHNDITAEAITEKLTAENAAELLKDSTLIIDCVDNVPTRQLLWAYGKQGTVGPVMHVGISRKGEGMINWSSTVLDTFPFNPATIAGREMKEQDIKEPPCEMYKYRSAGLVLVQAVAMATAFYLGKDPWERLQGAVQEGLLTCWDTNVSKTDLLVDPPYLVNDDLPIYNFQGEE